MTGEHARRIVRQAAEDAVERTRDSGARRMFWLGLALLIVSLAVFSAYFGIRYTSLLSHSQEQDEQISSLARQADDNASAAQALEDQVRSLGKQPVADVPETLPRGPEGDRGPRGYKGRAPTPEEIAAAVESYCDRTDCRGPAPSMQQVAAAVSSYCDTRGQCRGPEGQPGEPGADGQQGDQGPPPSDEQVLAAVATYCSERDNCQGPQGDPGRPPTQDEIRSAVEEFFDNRDIYCTPPDPPGSVTGEPWRCSTEPN